MKTFARLLSFSAFAAAMNASAMCVDGDVHACTVQGLPGTRECNLGRWSPCQPDGSEPNTGPQPNLSAVAACQLADNGSTGKVFSNSNDMAGGAPDLIMWNVSLHHSSSTNGRPTKEEVIAAADYVAEKTKRAGIRPEEMIIAMPSAHEVYWFLMGTDLQAKIFTDELAAKFPGHSFTYHQTNNNVDQWQMFLDVGDGANHYCGVHPNNSALIVGGNWGFTTMQNQGGNNGYGSNGGNEKQAFPECGTGEANWFGAYGIQHRSRGIRANIFTVQTDAANTDNAASQLAWAAAQTKMLPQTPGLFPSFVIGDFNGGLGGHVHAAWQSRGAVNIADEHEIISGMGQCPGTNGDVTSSSSPGNSSDPPDLDGTMQMARRRGPHGGVVLDGFLLDSPPFSNVLSARLPIPGVGPVPVWDGRLGHYVYVNGHVAQAAFFRYK